MSAESAPEDDIQAAGDDYRDVHWETLIASSLIVDDAPPSEFVPDPKDLA